MITIVDYKMGNLGSILNMLKKIGVQARLSSCPNEIQSAEKLILPGVGAFDAAMKNLTDMGLVEVLNKKVLEEKTPTLGICLGLQIMTKKSEEGRLPGLGWFDAEVRRFEASPAQGIKVPHMGWNLARPQKESPLFEKDAQPRFYFVHSYYIRATNEADILTSTSYGVTFASGLSRDNIAGVQFHPEKSHKFGMELLRSFAMRF